MHGSRKVLSSVKPVMVAHFVPNVENVTATLHPSDLWYRPHPFFASTDDAILFMGVLDFLFLLSYAAGLYVSGWLGDRVDPRYVLAGGMLTGAAATFLFGVPPEWGHFYNRYWYAGLWLANGFLQGPGWPACISLVAHSFHSAHGLILGIWSSSAGFGNIIGAILSSAVIDYGYEYVFLTISLILAAGAVITFCGIPANVVEKSTASAAPHTPESRNLSFCRVLLLPGVICYALAFACLKLVNYSLFFWLPYYLHNKFGWDAGAASALSACYDLGGLFGQIIAGGISDLPCISRHWVNTVFLLACVPCLFAYRATPGTSLALNGFVMSVTGFFVAGPSNLLSAVLGTDLARLPSLRGKRVLSTVTGLIDGTGSFGAAFGQLLVPFMQSHYGWNSVFTLFIVCSVLTLLFVIPPHIQSVRSRETPHEELVPSSD
ncbi:unnamed protein product [Mesocestoides corti]|nr:unnamed protein product [Mesocestoides corti]